MSVLSVALLTLAAVNATFIAIATVLDARRASALARALGATPRQVSLGTSAAQLLPALPGAVLGVPAGIGLYTAVSKGGVVTIPPLLTLIGVVVAALFSAMRSTRFVEAWSRAWVSRYRSSPRSRLRLVPVARSPKCSRRKLGNGVYSSPATPSDSDEVAVSDVGASQRTVTWAARAPLRVADTNEGEDQGW